MKKPTPRRRLEPSLASVRSAISNGSALLRDIDHRSAWARRLRDLTSDMVSDQGGSETISTAQMALIRRASMLCLQAELMEAHWATNGGEASPQQIETYQRCTNTLRRTLEAIGLERRSKDITPDPLTYAAEFDRRHAEDVEVVE